MVATIVVTADADHVMVAAQAVLHAEIHRAVATIDQVSRPEADPRIAVVHLPTDRGVTMIVALHVGKTANDGVSARIVAAMIVALHVGKTANVAPFPIGIDARVATTGVRVAMMTEEAVHLKGARSVIVVVMMTGQVVRPSVARLAIVIAAQAATTGVRVVTTVNAEHFPIVIAVRVAMMTGEVVPLKAEHFPIVIAAQVATTGVRVAMMIVVQPVVRMANAAALEQIVVAMIAVRVAMMTEAADRSLIAIAAQAATISVVPLVTARVVTVGPSVVRRSGNARLVMSGTSARNVQNVVLTTSFCPQFRRISMSRCCRDRFSQNSRRCHRDSVASLWITSHVH